MPRIKLRPAFFALHFLLVLGISCRETFGLMARGYTVLPSRLESLWKRAELLTSAALGWHDGLRAYVHLAGIDAGYGFFAPNVPDSYKLLFELHYPDGRVEYDLIGSDRAESNLRLSTLLDEVGATPSDPLREVMVKLLAHSIWQHHPEATSIRAILGSLSLPSVSEFRSGKTPSYVFLYAYDFSLTDP